MSVMPTSMPISAPSTNPSHLPITAAPSIVPSTGPSKSREPSIQPSAQPSQSKEPTYMPFSVPTLATDLHSIHPSVGLSDFPSLSNQLSDSPSGVPTSSKLPTYHPSSTHNPTSPPTEGYVVQGREFNPCEEGRVVLAGANVTLFSVLGQQIGQTTTDSDGRWEFGGLPIGRYFWVTDYPEC